MIKEERLNRSKAYKRIKKNVDILSSSNRTMEDIFNISFSYEKFTLFNQVKDGSLINITYGEAKEHIEQFANYFSSQIKKGTKYVGLLLENSPEWIYSYYGLLMAGFVPVLLSTASTDQDNIEILKDLGADIVITDKNFALKSINPYEIKESSPIKEKKWANGTVFVTSGTSGKSKIYLYTGEELSDQLINVYGLMKDRPMFLSFYKGFIKQYLVLPLYHIFGFTAGFLWFTFFNVTVVLPQSLAPDHIREGALLGEPTHLLAVPLFWEHITKKVLAAVKEKNAEKKFAKALRISTRIQSRNPRRGARFVKNVLFKGYIDKILGKSLQFCITGGTAISEETLKIINGLGYPLVNGYGSTEIAISSFVNPKTIKSRNSLSIGEPFRNYKYSLNKQHELCVVTNAGYNSALIDGKFVERDKNVPIETKDICEIEFDKYFIKGRLDEIFVGKNGENYSLPQIEKRLMSNLATDTVCVSCHGKMALVLSYDKNIPQNLIKKDLSNIIHNENFTKYAIGKIFVTNDELPKANGIKIKRNVVQSMLDNGQILSLDISMSDDANEKVDLNPAIYEQVVKTFKEVLKVERVESDSDFFIDLGGDSLSYFEFVSALENEFKTPLEINIQVTRTPKLFTLQAMKQLPNDYGMKDYEKSKNSQEIQAKKQHFKFLHFVGRCFIKVTGLIPFFIFVTPRFFYSSKKAKKDSRKLKGGAILIGNHTSTFDYVTYIFKHFFKVVHTFVGPAIYRFKTLRHLCNVLENIEVKKDDPANFEALKTARDYLKRGKTIAIFPEGRFEDNPGEIERFSSSAIRLAFESKTPIIPHYFKGNYGLFKRAKINVGEKIYVHELVKKDVLTEEDIKRVNAHLLEVIKKLKHQLNSFEVHKTQSRISKKLFISDLFKLTGFPFGYLVFWNKKIYIGNKKKIREAMRERVILAPTHTSFFDVPIMYLYFVSRRLRVFALKEAVSSKILGPLARGAGVIPYDRDAKGGFDLKAFKMTDEILEGNGCVVMFPQGHIVEDGKLEGHDLKLGLATHSLRRDVPIIPIVFGNKTKPLKINKMYIGDPIYPKDYFDVVEASKENIAKFTDIIQQKMIELQSISQKHRKKVKEK